MQNGVYVSGTSMPLLLARNASTPNDQSSLNQGSFSRKTSSVQGVIGLGPTTYVSSPEIRVLMPATPVIVQSPREPHPPL